MGFQFAYLGRMASSELVEFSENLLSYAASFMFSQDEGNEMSLMYIGSEVYCVSNVEDNSGYQATRPRTSRTPQERIFGVFLTYCLFFLQPGEFVSMIRCSVAQMNQLHAFLNDVLIPEEHFEAVYCIYRLVSTRAFAIQPFEVEFNPMTNRRFPVAGGTEQIGGENLMDESVEAFPFLQELAKDFKKADQLHDYYEKSTLELAKTHQDFLPGGRSEPRLSTRIDRLHKESEQILQKQSASGSRATTTASSATRASIKAEIRLAAYSTSVQQKRHRRHRQDGGIINESPDCSPSKRPGRLQKPSKTEFQTPTK